MTAAAGCATGAAAAPARHRHDITAPTRLIASSHRGFNPLVPFARFGWLPRGYSAPEISVAQSTNQENLSASTASGARAIAVSVDLHGLCRLVTSDRRLYCPKHGGKIALQGRAPRIHGRRAFWLARSPGLVWKYSASGWAYLTPFFRIGSSGRPPSRAALLRVAAGMSFGLTRRPRFAYRLTGIPAGWQPDLATFASTARVLYGRQIDVDLPGKLVNEILVAIWPTDKRSSCYFYPANSRWVTLDGKRAILTKLPGTKFIPHYLELCARDIHGLFINISVQMQTRTARRSGLGSPITIFHKLRLLGPDRKHWTRHPLS